MLANMYAPMSQLKKKSKKIAYYFLHEGCSKDEWRTTYVNTHNNPTNLMKKPLPSGKKRSKFLGRCFRGFKYEDGAGARRAWRGGGLWYVA